MTAQSKCIHWHIFSSLLEMRISMDGRRAGLDPKNRRSKRRQRGLRTLAENGKDSGQSLMNQDDRCDGFQCSRLQFALHD